MIKDDLKQMRLDMDLTQEEFGAWLADQINATQDASMKPLSPYMRHRISAWETGELAVPMKIENVIIRRQLKQKDKLIETLRQRRRRTQKP